MAKEALVSYHLTEKDTLPVCYLAPGIFFLFSLLSELILFKSLTSKFIYMQSSRDCLIWDFNSKLC